MGCKSDVMKKLLLTTVLAVFGFTVAGMIAGCSPSKPKVDIAAQLEALKSSDANVKSDALATIAEAGPAAATAVPQLIEELKNSNALVRRLAAYALGQVGAPAATVALPELRKLMDDGDRDVVRNALNAIKAIDPKSPEAKVQIPNVSQ